MADERDHAAEDRRGDEATRRMSTDEPTSTFDPFADDDEEADVESTRAMPEDLESTRAMPEDLESTRAMPADAESTRAMPGNVESTRPMPVSDHPAPPQEPGVWAARASIPVSVDPAPGPEPVPWQEEIVDERADRSWLRPVLIAPVVLVLLAILGTGLWLIFTHLGGRSAPAPVVPATTTGTPTPTETAPVTQVPTAPTATAPTTAKPAQVAVPDVVGQSESAARQQLAAYGLTFTVVRRTTGDAAPGTVIATDPGAGTMVTPGSRVTLVVAAAPAATPTGSPSRPAPPSPTRSASATAAPSKH